MVQYMCPVVRGRKMVHRCVVPGCGHYTTGAGFRKIPTDPIKRKLWCEKCGIDEKDLSDGARICGLHFPKEFSTYHRLPADVLPFRNIDPDDQASSSSTSGPPVGSNNANSVVVVLDNMDDVKRRDYSASLSQNLSQASSKSAPSAKDSTFSPTDSPSERILEKLFHSGDSTRPKQCILEKDGTRNFIVNERQLRRLLRHCPACGFDVTTVSAADASAINHGVDVEFIIDCPKCRDLVSWSTQPPLPESGLQKGNLDLTAAVLHGGNTFEDMNTISTILNLKIMSEATFYNYARAYVYPQVDEYFISQNQAILEEIKDSQSNDKSSSLSVGVDCRFSRPGYTATFGITSAMDLETGKVIAAVVNAKTDVGTTSSAAMETNGTRQVLASLIQPFDSEEDEPLAVFHPVADGGSNFMLPAPASVCPIVPLRVGLLITDDNRSVAAMVRKHFPHLEHQLDPWHLRKNIMKKFSEEASKKVNEPLLFWLESIKNWIWTSMRDCVDGDHLVELFRSMVYHIRGDHAWEEDGDFRTYKKCSHKDLSEAGIAYLPIESDAYAAFVDIVEDSKIHEKLRRCSAFEHTSLLESFHSLLCKYVRKDRRYTGSSFVSRTRLAILDWNENVGRPLQLDKNGGEMITFHHPAAAGAWRARRMREERTHLWRHELMRNLNEFAVRMWQQGHVVSRETSLMTHLPLTSMYEPLDRVSTAAQLYR